MRLPIYSFSIKFLQAIEALCKKKVIADLALLKKCKNITNSNCLPGDGTKMLGVGIALKQAPSTLNYQPRGFINLETKPR